MILPFPFFIGQASDAASEWKASLTVLVISLVSCCLTLVLWPVNWFVRRHFGTKVGAHAEGAFAALWECGLFFILDLIFLGALVGLLVAGLRILNFFSSSHQMVLPGPIHRSRGSRRHHHCAAKRAVRVAEQTAKNLGKNRSYDLAAGVGWGAVVLTGRESAAL